MRGPISMRNNMAIEVHKPNKQKEHLHANRKQIIVWMNRVEDVKVYSNHGSTNFRYNLILVKMKKCLLMFVVSR